MAPYQVLSRFFVESFGVDGGVKSLGHTAGSALEKSVQCRRVHL